MTKIIIVDYSLEIVIAIINNDYFEPYFYIKYTVGTESIQTPLNFSLFVILQPFAKII